MAKLVISVAQKDQITDIENFIDTAFKNGVEDTGAIPVLDPILDFASTKLNNTQRQITKDVFKLALCALLKELGGVTGTISLAKLTGGGVNGSLTFTNGILTAFVQPT